MWEIKIFKTEKSLKNWLEKNKNKYQIIQVFVNNSFALEVKRLRKIL